MSRKFVSMAVVFIMIMTLTLTYSNAQIGTIKDGWNKARYGDKIDIGPKLRKMAKDLKMKAKFDKEIIESAEKISLDGEIVENNSSSGSTGENSSATETVPLTVGAIKIFPAYDNINGYYLKTFRLASIGEKCEVWVANDLDFPVSDPRITPEITQEQLDTVSDAFDEDIYQQEINFFGTPDTLEGGNALLPSLVSKKLGMTSDYYDTGDEKTIILVDNIRDEAYYDSSYPFFVAGFYSSTLELYTDRNIITIDTLDWDKRLQEDFLPTIAHEFQHLIHDDNDSDEETWINEGMADFAQYLCDYGHDWGHVNYFLDHPENSLVTWDEYYNAETGPETLADYGQAYLFQLYLNDHFGQNFIQTLAKDTDNGIISVNNILAEYNTGIDFDELFRRFTLALTVDSTNLSKGIYNFNSIDLKINYDGASESSKPGVPAWGADYIKLNSTTKIKDIIFNGIKFVSTPWEVISDPLRSGNNVLWGNQGDERDNQIIIEADLAGLKTATLNFDNLISIEEQWDFGMVQVSTDNGATWKSLSNRHTRSDIVSGGYPAIITNLPGFTGYYRRWITESFDLSQYAGQKVLINFRYMTDWGYNDSGWFIDNISIPEIGYSNTCDSLDSFKSIDEVMEQYVEYSVSFINEKDSQYKVLNIDPFAFELTEEQKIQLSNFLSNGNNYMVVWYAAPIGNKDPVDYSYTVNTRTK